MRPSSRPVSGRAHGRFRTSVSAAKNPVPSDEKVWWRELRLEAVAAGCALRLKSVNVKKWNQGWARPSRSNGVANARTLRQGDKGTVFVSTRLLDKVYAINEQSGRREVKTLYSGLYRPNGLAFANGTLYIAELAKILKVEKIEDNLDNPPKPVVIYDDLPK